MRFTRFVTEYLLPALICPCCGKATMAGPAGRGVPGSVAYGPGVNAAALLLTGYGNIPAERAADLIGMLTGVPVSPGFVDKASSRLDERLQDAGFDEAILAFFTGFLIADGYGAYQKLGDLAGVQQCCQHIIRRCRQVAGLGPGSLRSWTEEVIGVLRSAHKMIEEARARGDPASAAQALADLRRRYDKAVASGRAPRPRLGPRTTGRPRPR